MDRITPWLREKIAEASLEELREAAASLRQNRGMMFGMMYSGPPIPARDELLAEIEEAAKRLAP